MTAIRTERTNGGREAAKAPTDVAAFEGEIREFILRDLNRFWITFGQPSVFEVLMTGVLEGNTEMVQAALSVPLDKGGVKPETLTAALAIACLGACKSVRSFMDPASIETVDVLIVGAHQPIEATVPGGGFARHDYIGLQGRKTARHDLFAQSRDVGPGLDCRRAE